MAKALKYNLFLDELISLEKQIYKFVQSKNEVAEENRNLTKKIDQLEKENEILKLKIQEIENKLNNSILNSAGFEEEVNGNNENLNTKKRIDNFIDKIDYHLRSLT